MSDEMTGMKWLIDNSPTIRDYCNEKLKCLPTEVRSIYEAAPDLLEACEAALNDRMYKDWPEIATLLMNAIEKAKGKA